MSRRSRWMTRCGAALLCCLSMQAAAAAAQQPATTVRYDWLAAGAGGPS